MAFKRKKSRKRKKREQSDKTPAYFSWYPGHMAKAQRSMSLMLNRCDLVVFLLDSRAPDLCRHPELERRLTRAEKPFLFVLSKTDLAPPSLTESWLKHYRQEGRHCYTMSILDRRSVSHLRTQMNTILENRDVKFSRLITPNHIMVAGIPNIGKSSLLNALTGKKKFATGKKAGITRGQQWVKTPEGWYLLDTPGVLYPRIETVEQLAQLAILGSVPKDKIPLEETACALLSLEQTQESLDRLFPDRPKEAMTWEQLEWISAEQGHRQAGGRLNTIRTSQWLIKYYSDGKCGPIGLQFPPFE